VRFVCTVDLTAATGLLTWENYQARIDEWWRRFVRRFPGAFAIVRVEPTPGDGANGKSGGFQPHFHILIYFPKSSFGPEYRNAPRIWREVVAFNDEVWASVVGQDTTAGCRVYVYLLERWEQDGRAIAAYVGKLAKRATYHAKEGDAAANAATKGRSWGIKGRAAYRSCCSVAELPISQTAIVKVQRVLVKLQQRKRQRWWVRDDDGRWGPCRFDPYAEQAKRRFLGAPLLSLRRTRPRVYRNVEVPVWAESVTAVEAGGNVRSAKREAVKLEVQVHAFGPAVHYVDPVQVRQLVAWAAPPPLPF
jgi:hypothetical protein